LLGEDDSGINQAWRTRSRERKKKGKEKKKRKKEGKEPTTVLRALVSLSLKTAISPKGDREKGKRKSKSGLPLLP